MIRLARDFAVWVWIGVCTMLCGCAVTLSDEAGVRAAGFFTGLAPSDEVQTLDVSVIGLSVDATRQSFDLGYKKYRMTRIPAFDRPSLVPSVLFTTTVGDAAVTDTLKVGEKP